MNSTKDLKLISRYRTAIMGFAALWIFVFHEWRPMLEGYGLLYKMEQFVKRIGFVGVDIFFFLSGIGMVFAIGKYSVASFYKRRFLRVFIPYLIIALVMMMVDGWGLGVFLKKLLGYNFLMVNMYDLLWFVQAIIIFYALFPLYYCLFKRAPGKYQFTAAVLLVWLFLSIVLEGTLRHDLYGFTNRIPVFLIGVLAGWMIQNNKLVFTRLTWIVCLLIFAMGVYFAFLTNYRGYSLLVPEPNCCIPNLMMATSGSCLLAKVFSVLDKYCGLFGKGVLKFFGFFGTISFEFYCVQEWLGVKIWYIAYNSLGDGGLNIVIFLGTLAASLMLYGVCLLIKKGGKWLTNYCCRLK